MALNESTLVSFKRAHQYLLAGIDQADQVLRRFAQAWAAARELDQRLLNHLSRQDLSFYKDLRALLGKDRPSLKMLEFLEHDLKEFKVAVLFFSETYFPEGGVPHSRNFIRHFQVFRQKVIDRVDIEEQYLLPLIATALSEDRQES